MTNKLDRAAVMIFFTLLGAITPGLLTTPIGFVSVTLTWLSIFIIVMYG